MKLRIKRRWRKRLREGWDSMRRAVLAPFRLLGSIGRKTGRALLRWWRSRTKRLLLQGLPALVVALGVLGLAVTLARANPNLKEASYQAHAQQCMQTSQYDEAATCFDRLVSLDPGHVEYRFGAARAAEAKGEMDRAVAIMRELAPETGTGYGPAHSWVARWLSQQPNPSAERTAAVERHLLRALAKQPGMAEANVQLAQLYINTRRLQLAEPYLLQAIQTRPELRLALARLYRSLGRNREADFQTGTALAHFQQKAQEETDNHLAWLRWAEAAALRGDYRQAVNVLQRALGLTQATIFRDALAEMLAAWSDTLADGAMTQFGDRLAMIEQGLGYDPRNAGLLQRLLVLTKPPRDEVVMGLGVSMLAYGASPLATAPVSSLGAGFLFGRRSSDPSHARAALHNLLLKGQAPATVYFALGMDAWEQGKFSEARRYWEQAYQQAPDMAVVSNNLAWLLTTREPTDFARALQLANSIVERFPDQPEFRGTRGHVLARMKRWKEALPDLVASLRAFPNNRETHAALADTYEQLGFAREAAEHRQLSQSKE